MTPNRLLTTALGLVLSVSSFVLPHTATAQSSNIATIDKAKLQALADQSVQDGLVGISMAVYTPDQGMTLVTSGVSDRNSNAPLKTTDIARIASVSKVWVATVVMQFVQEGKLALSDPIATYIDKANAQHIQNADTATVQQLLSHTSGILDYYNEGGFGQDVPSKMDFTINEALKYVWDKPAKFSPGEKYEYSDTNTVLLAQALENISGKPFAELLRTRIFTPLGLQHTFVEVFEPVTQPIVRGYATTSDGTVTEFGDKYQGGGLPDGALVATPEDMAIFMNALFVQGKLLDKSTLAQMVSPIADAGDDYQIALHIFVTKTDHGTRYEHNGAIDGYRSIEMTYPDSNLTITMWTNCSGNTQDGIFSGLQDSVVKVAFGGA